MKINEIIVESRDGTINDLQSIDHTAGSQGIMRMRDQGGYDRVYHMNRIMMAAAMADGKSKKAVDMPQSSWQEKYNTAHPYTDEEHNMMHSALKTVDSEHDEPVPRSKSREEDIVHKISPVALRKKNKHGV